MVDISQYTIQITYSPALTFDSAGYVQPAAIHKIDDVPFAASDEDENELPLELVFALCDIER